MSPAPRIRSLRCAGAAASVRLFVALWPGVRVRQALVDCRARMTGAGGGKAVSADRLHLTLHFLGDVPREQVAVLAAALQVPFNVFDLQLDLAQIWNGGVAVLCPTAVPDALLQLHGDLAAALRRIGLPVEAREFRPHVTLARRVRESPRRAVAAVAAVHWRVAGYALVRSSAAGGYEVLQHYPGPQASMP